MFTYLFVHFANLKSILRGKVVDDATPNVLNQSSHLVAATKHHHIQLQNYTLGACLWVLRLAQNSWLPLTERPSCLSRACACLCRLVAAGHRHDNVSEELHVVQATAYIPTADRRPGSAMPSPDGSQRRPEHDSSRSRDSGPGIGGSGGEHTNEGSSTDPHGAHRPVQLTYTFNAESTVYPLHPSAVGLAAGWDGAGQGTGSQRATAEGTPPSADGADDGVGGGSAAEQLSRLVLSRQYLVPSEQAHAAMGQYGTADLPAGARAAWGSWSGPRAGRCGDRYTHSSGSCAFHAWGIRMRDGWEEAEGMSGVVDQKPCSKERQMHAHKCSWLEP